ncbi:MAG: hypothetical protein ICV74_07235, partial [Thermoleophilia bacterium]|nr:hypothetical protein [Thermoleophilia bacterium]
MRAGEVIREAWELYRGHWRHLLPVAFVVFALVSLFSLLLVALLGPFGQFSAAFVLFAGVFWLQGALVLAVEDVRDGRADLSLRETLSRVRPRLNTLAVAGIGAAVVIAIGIVLLVVPGLVLATWWLVVVPVIMLEGRGVFGAFGRSRQLVRGHGWSAFGLFVLTALILIAANLVLELALSPLEESVRRYASDVLSNTLFAPFVALTFTLAYYRLRTLKAQAP